MPGESQFPVKWALVAGLVATVGLSAFAYKLGKARNIDSAAPIATASSGDGKPAPESEARVYQSPIPGTKLMRSVSLTPAGPGALRLALSVDFVASNKQRVEGVMGEFEATILPIETEANYMDSHLDQDNAGKQVARRYGLGAELNPIPFLRLSANVRYVANSTAVQAEQAATHDETWMIFYAVFSF